MDHLFFPRARRHVPWLAALFLWSAAAAFAQAPPEADPPARVANLSWRTGSVVFAPEGDDEWVDLPVNRPLTRGDRLWSDQGARAELHLGSATLHVDGESHLGVSALDAEAAQFMLMQGSVNARVRELVPGENFEIDTPNLAFRAQQPGDFRIDVEREGRETRVTVHSGQAMVFGEGGQSVALGAGQSAAFAGRTLAPGQQAGAPNDAFGQWAAERNRAEDLSVSARHVPRGVVGYPQLDQHGTWAQDDTHGQVWYPQVTVQDWAPYRYGRWEDIQPWGWTWIDDAPWGFAPFHYGRWAQIGSRWAWVPGDIGPRPVYAPALVAFIGGAGGGLTIGAGPGVGWYPLGPGEAWWPTYRHSTRYVRHANAHIDLHRYHRNFHGHMHRQRPYAVTAVREDDFRRGRPTRGHWRSVSPSAIGQAQFGTLPPRPDRRERAERPGNAGPRMQAAPPRPGFAAPSGRPWGGRDAADGRGRGQAREPVQQGQQMQPGQQVQQVQPMEPRQPRQPGMARGPDRGDAVREQERAQREQRRLQMDTERGARQQMRQQQMQREPQPGQPARQWQPRQDREAQRDPRGGERGVRAVEPRAAPQLPQNPGFGAPQMRAAPVQRAAPIGGGRDMERAERQQRGGPDRARGGERGGDEGRGRGRGG